MKKFWVGLLSVLVLLGGAIFASCGSKNVSIELQETYTEICLNDGLDNIATITAEVKGISDGTVTVSSSNTAVATATSSFGRGVNVISIEGLSEGEAEIYVTSNYNSGVQRTISVVVYSDVKEMSQKEVDSLDGKSNLFVLRNQGEIEAQHLDLNNCVDEFIKFAPEKAKKNIVWSLPENFELDAEITGNVLTIGKDYLEKTITVIATDDSTGVKTDVTLGVIDELDENTISMRYNHSGAGDRPLPDLNESGEEIVETPISLVPNISTDPAYRANVIITVPGKEGVDITPRIFTNGIETNLLVAERLGYDQDTGTYIYELKAGNVNVNRTFEVYFDMGYEKYNYKVSSQHFTVRCYERINRIEVLSVDGNNEVDATGITQDIYTNYSNTDGAFYKVRLLPTTVVNSSRMYKVSLDYSRALRGMLDIDVGGEIEVGDVIDENTLNIYYRQGSGLVRLNMEGSDLLYTGTTEINAEELYIKANDSRVKAYIKDVVMTLTSVDNTSTTAQLKLNLYKAAGALDFGEGEYNINLATHEARTVTKTFTLAGQTSIDGLSISTTGDGFAVSGIRQIDSDMVAATVTFSVDFSVRNIGYTGVSSYKINHRNGFSSAEYEVSLYLPLTDAQVDFDRTNDSVLDFAANGKLYQLVESSLIEVTNGSASISEMYVKNGSTVQLSTRNNQSNGQTAEAQITYKYYDFDSEEMTREAFEALMGSSPAQILNRAREESKFISVTRATKAMQCNAVGCSYLIISFEGKDANGNTVTFVRIVFVENYVTPSEMVASPQGVSVYANNSVSEVGETERIVRISLGNVPITYNDLIENYSFISGIAKGNSTDLDAGKATVSAETRTAVWEEGYYMLSEIDIQPTYITFKVTGLATRGVQAIPDQLTVRYTGKDKKTQSAVIDVRVLNADRVESVEILNIIPEQDADGNSIYQMYFDVDAKNPEVLVFRTQPELARNKNLTYLVTSRTGDISGFVAVSDSNNGTLVRLRSNEGMIGYIYALPTDAIFQNMINYYTITTDADGKTKYVEGVPVSYYQLGRDYTGADFDGTWYSYLKANAYFLNNNGEAISFDDILLRVEVTVADGSSEELAYHIFTEQEVNDIRNAPTKWYRLMNNVALDEWVSISEFSGGIKGDNENVTITLKGQPFTDVNSGTVKELVFNGQVVGGGFVANENYGSVDSVRIDVDTATRVNEDGSNSIYVRSSTVNAAGKQYAGSIVGQNYGTLRNVSALGASVIDGVKVGGLVGQMSTTAARLINGKFEIYTFEGDTNNSLRGQTVGGVIGEFVAGLATNVYAYDYALKNDGSSKLSAIGGSVGALIGQASGSINLTDSFAVINITSLIGLTDIGATISIKNTYLSYYNGGTYLSYAYDTDGRLGSMAALSGLTLPGDTWALIDDSDFLSEVNGGFPYLKAFHQNLPVSSVEDYHAAYSNPVKTANGLYKAINVVASQTEERVILFNYQVSDFDKQTMNTSELRDLDTLNIISVADLLGISSQQAESLVILSANAGVINISGSNLIVKRQGEVELTLSSKQDYTKSKKIIVKTLYALSDIRAERVSLGGSVEIAQNSPEPLQRGKNLTVVYSFTNPSLHLGNRGNTYDLISNTTSFVSVMKEGEMVLTDNVESSDVTFTYTTTGLSGDNFNIETTLQLRNLVNVTVDSLDMAAINKTFTRVFRLRLFNGAIELGLAGGGEEISITPSTMGVVEVTLRTNDENDEISPILSLKTGNGYDALTLTRLSDNMWTASYLGVPRITVTREAWTVTENSDEGSWTKKANFYFSVHESYRGQIPANQQYKVLLQSNLQVESEEFELLISRQDFTKIDISNYQVTQIVYNKLELGSNEYGTIYTVNESVATSVLAPGSTSILAVNINPDYAYYQYLTLEYSTTEASSVLSPLKIEYMTRRALTSDYYVARDGSVVSKIGNGIRVIPVNKNVNNLYFKLWAETKITSDMVVTLTAKFYDGISGNPIKTVNFPLTISHLTEPKILVDGSTSAIVAKGQTATVQVVVPYDQEVNIDSLTVDNVQTGITIYSDWKYDPDEKAGTKTYTTTLSASIRATLSNDASGMFAISVSVRREINGYEEIKATTAMVHLVDFKVDLDNISLAGQEDDTFIAYVGMAQPLVFDYPLIPGEYRYDESDSASQAAMESIVEKRENFLDNGYFADPDTRYYINYSNPGTTSARRVTVDRLLSFNSNGVWHDIYTGVNSYNTIGGRVEWFYDDVRNVMSVRGSEISNAEIDMKLHTTIYIAGQTFESDYLFKIVVRAYSDEDVPLLVYNKDQFLNMAEGDAQNYILMDDIYLDNYTPIDTTAIDSLDGNGYTIHINSFNTNPDGGALNLALFNNVSSNTTLKNVRVNLYRGGQITVDVSKYTSINIAGFALTNSGTITNCEVVSFRGNGSEVFGETGLNIKYIRGANTSPISITGLNETSTVAGFVNTNSGSITNSRVGGDSIYTIGAEISNNSAGQQVVLGYNRDQYSLEKFNIIAQGNVAGFVNSNSGAIASSFVKRVGFVNDSDNSSFYTAGFAGLNSGKILTSYIEGVKEERQTDSQCLQGSSINSKLGIIAGFVYQNNDDGLIQDSYSNILIANKSGDETVFLASGFVYSNEATLENCFSSSQVANLRFSQMNFSGVDSKGNLQTVGGSYVNCYYYVSHSAGSDNPVEAGYGTGATKLTNIDDPKYFYGFSFTESSRKVEGIWAFNEDRLVLVEPNNIAFSNRYRLPDKDDNEKYSLPYSTVYASNSNTPISLAYGSEINPIIIRSAQEFVNVTGRSTSSFISSFFTESNVHGNYRLVNDIDFAELLSDEQKTADMPSTVKTFTGTFYGNGFTMSNLSITAANTPLAFGMFASIENAVLINVDITVTQVVSTGATMVGSLAGYIKNSNIINVNISYNENSEIQGLNFVGGVAGMVYGDSKLKNITVTDPNIIATSIPLNGVAGVEGSDATIDNRRNPVSALNARTAFNLRTYLERNVGTVNLADISPAVRENIADLVRNYSYAGGMFGYVDTFKSKEVGEETYAYVKDMELGDYAITKVRLLNSVNVRGQVAGGIAGFTGYNTHVKDAGVELADNQASTTSHILAVRFYAGGLVGQAYGSFAQVYSQYTSALQNTIENSLRAYYVSNGGERGGSNIFALTSDTETYSQKYVGGLIGYAGSGSIAIAYSKLNVTSMSADYVGGLIGGVNTGDANSYYISDGKDDAIITNYYINEAFSTGDLRAKNAAGGIIGQVNKGSRVKLAAVNSSNFISLNKFNGIGDSYTAEELAGAEGIADLTFDRINVYAIAGNFSFDTTNLQELVDSLSFMQLYPEGTSDENSTVQAEVSVGTVKRYTSTIGADIKLSVYPGYDRIAQITDTTLANIVKPLSETFSIANISTMETAEQGHQAVYGSFIGTQLWSTDNWYHNSDSFYPNIKFSVAQQSFLYLDQYNALEVLRSMKNSNTPVKVRGKVSENVERYGDVDLRAILTKEEFWGGSKTGVTGYYGLFSGFTADEDAAVVTEAGARPGLILSTPLFTDLREGFVVSDLTVRYQKDDNVSERGTLFSLDRQDGDTTFSGAFVNNEIKANGSGSIKNLTLIFNEQVYLQESNGSGVGLVAPSIAGANLEGIKIEFFEASGEKAAVTATSNSFGLIAGSFIQDSESNIKASGIDIYDGRDFGGNLVMLNSSGAATYVGAYFGKVKKESTTSDGVPTANMSIQIGSLKHWQIQGAPLGVHTWRAYDNFSETIFIGNDASALYLGGYIGQVENVDNIEFAGASGDGTLARVNLGIGSNITEALDAGLVIGSLNKEGEVAIKQGGDDTIPTVISGRIYSSVDNVKVSSASTSQTNLGGIVGYTTSNVTISNVNVSLQVDGKEDSGALQNGSTETDLKNNYTQNIGGNYLFNPFVSTSKVANVGGYIGYATNTVKIDKSGEGYARINEKQEPISVRADAANVGSMVGLLEKSVGNLNSVSEVLIVSGQFRSNALIQVEDFSDVTPAVEGATSKEKAKELNGNKNIGGFVGKIQLTSVGSSGYTITLGDTNTEKPSAYMGQIFLAAAGYHTGGIVGSINGMSEIDNGSVTLQNTVFGGAVKIYGKEATADSAPWGGSFVIGGTIANFENGGDESKAAMVNINNNYNFGDVFVMYRGEGQRLGQMAYGGLVGNSYTNISNANAITDNYILNTYNNPRPNSADVTGAVFSSVNRTNISQTNYYNHAVCLLTDDNAKDAGYTKNYKDTEEITGGGYSAPGEANSDYGYDSEFGEENRFTEKEGLAGYISNHISNVYDDTTIGIKLNPRVLPSTGISEKNPVFNGMVYYVVESNTRLATKSILATTLSNVALIGNGFTIESIQPEEFSIGLVEKMSGLSFISGVNFNIDVTVDLAQMLDSANNPLYTEVGGLVGAMSSGTIYAVGVLGKLSIGGDGTYNVGGMVGMMSGGYIMNSFTDVEIIYRAAKGENDTRGRASAIANTTHTDAIIDRTYAVGSVTSYIDVYIDAFTYGPATVRNCYTAANLFWKDYTSAETSSSNKLSAFKDATISSTVCYDTNAMGVMSNKVKMPKADGTIEEGKDIPVKTTLELCTYGDPKTDSDGKQVVDTYLGENWENDVDYNYGYPTQAIGYLKASSYKTASEYYNEDDRTAVSYGITTYTYTRLNNAEAYVASGRKTDTTGNYNNYYYTIPNVGVWYYRLNQFTGTKTAAETDAKLTLRNDIYFNYIGENSTITLADNVKLILDGRTHRLYNFTGAGLFENINVGSSTNDNKVINVDILKATISGRSVLAKTIQHTLVSNVTLSGKVTSSTETDAVGALAAKVLNSQLYSVTNNCYVYSSDSETGDVGGLVGNVGVGTTIQRCVNNGPVYYNQGAQNTSKAIYVGGLVGTVSYTSGAATTISLSYNTGSVSAAYSAQDTGYAIYAGGIVGNNTGYIDRCYNSGLIKAGNKHCGSTNYAGGIVGYSTDSGLITNCINEGSVEALAKNASYKFNLINYQEQEVELISKQNIKTKAVVQIISDTGKNVYADGIGIAAGSVGYLSQISGTSNINSNTEIIHNGSAFSKGDVVNQEDIGDTVDSAYQLDISGQLNGSARIRGYESLANGFDDAYKFEWNTTFKNTYSDSDFVVTSRDNYNFPTGYYVKLSFTARIQRDGYSGEGSASNTIDYYISRAANDSSTRNYQDLVNGRFLGGLGREELSLSDAAIEAKSEIVKATESNGEQESVTIAGRNYLLTNTSAADLMNKMNSAYAYTASYTPSESIINMSNYTKYKFSVNDPSKNIVSIGATGWNVPKDSWPTDGKPTFDLLIYTKDEIPQDTFNSFWDDVQITFSYVVDYRVELDLSSIKYSSYENGDVIDINIYESTTVDPSPNRTLHEMLGGGYSVGFNAKRANEANAEVLMAYKVDGLGDDVYLVYNSSTRVFTYYKGLYIEKDSLNNPGQYTQCNTSKLNVNSFVSKTIDVYYGLRLKLEFSFSEVEINKKGEVTIVNNDKFHRGTTSVGNYTHQIENTVGNDISQTVQLGDSGQVVVVKNDKYNISNNTTTANSISDYLTASNTEYVDNLLYLKDVAVINKLKLVDSQKEGVVKLGDLTILTYTKVIPDEGETLDEGDIPPTEGEGDETEDKFVWTLVTKQIEMAEGLEEDAASYVFKVAFDEETLTLTFVYDEEQVSEEERDSLNAYINGLIEGGNYLTFAAIDNSEIETPPEGGDSAETGDTTETGEETEPVEPTEPVEVIALETVSYEETPVTERIYTFISEFSVNIARNTPMTLKFADTLIAKWNGAWTNIASDVTIDGIDATVTLADGKFTITFANKKEEDKVTIESILDSWVLSYDTISYSLAINDLSSGDSVSIKYEGSELAYYDGQWTKSNDLILEGLTADFVSGVWAYNDVVYDPENDVAVKIVAEFAKITDSYKSMRVSFTLPIENIDKVIVYGATEESVIATYSNGSLTAVGNVNSDVVVSANGNSLIYQINCDEKTDAQIDNLIAEINRSIYYRQYDILNKNVYNSSYEDGYLHIPLTWEKDDSKELLSVHLEATLARVSAKNSAFNISGDVRFGLYEFTINTASGLWQSKTANGVTLYYGSQNIMGYDATYKVDKIRVRITNAEGFGYLQVQYDGLVENGMVTEKELYSGESIESEFVSNGKSSFEIGYTVYRTYVEMPLTTGAYDLLNHQDMSEDASKYFDNITDYQITHGIHIKDDDSKTVAGFPNQTYTYNKDGVLVSYTKPASAKQQASGSSDILDVDVTYSYTKLGTGGIWTYEKSTTDTETVGDVKVPATQRITLMSLTESGYTPYGLTATYETLDKAFEALGGKLTIEETFYVDGTLTARTVEFTKGNFQLDNLTDATRTKSATITALDESGNPIIVDGHEATTDGTVRYKWNKVGITEIWSYVGTSETALLRFDGYYWYKANNEGRFENSRAYNSLSELFENEGTYDNGQKVINVVYNTTHTEEVEGTTQTVIQRVSIKFKLEDFATPEAVPINQVAVTKDNANRTLRAYIEGDVNQVLTSKATVDYFNSPTSEKIQQVSLPGEVVVSNTLNYQYVNTTGNNLVLEDSNKSELDFNDWDSVYSSSENKISFNYKFNGLDKVLVHHTIRNTENFKFTSGNYPVVKDDGATVSMRSRAKVAVSRAKSDAIAGIIFTRNINLGEVPQYMSFASHLAGNDYTLSYTASTNSTLFNLIDGKDDVVPFIKDLNVVGQIDAMTEDAGARQQSAAILTLDNNGILKDINTYGNIRNVEFDAGDVDSRIASGAIITNRHTALNITNYASINGLNATQRGTTVTTIVGLVYNVTSRSEGETSVAASATGLENRGLLVAGNGYNGYRRQNSSSAASIKNGCAGADVYIINRLKAEAATVAHTGDTTFNIGYVVSGKGGAAAMGLDGNNGNITKNTQTSGNVEGIHGTSGEASGTVGASGKVYSIGTAETTANAKVGGEGNTASGGNGGLSGFLMPIAEKDGSRIGNFIGQASALGAAAGAAAFAIAAAWMHAIPIIGQAMYAAGLAIAAAAGAALEAATATTLIYTAMQPSIYYGIKDFTCGYNGDKTEEMGANVSPIQSINLEDNIGKNIRPGSMLQGAMNTANMFAEECDTVDV